jgi:hypothetical protein
VASQNEKYLSNITPAYILDPKSSKNLNLADNYGSAHYSLIDLKSQIQVIKIYMSFCASLINLVCLDKEFARPIGKPSHLFPSNWQYLSEVGQSHDYLFQNYAPNLKDE